MKQRILVIDDDQSILRLLKNILEQANYEVETRSRLLSIDSCDFLGFDLILLDIMMPEITGIDICQSIRKQIKVPILFLTAKQLEQDILEGIEAGADDYITKPFKNKELIARINMHLRREKRLNNLAQTLTFGNLTINPHSKEVAYENEVLPITKREFEILYLLGSNPNRTFSMEEIYDTIYPQSSDTQWRSISEYIYQIRQKLKPFNINPFKTIWGGGYKWSNPEVSTK